ncbi:MAG: tetratricopeptide repeat protein [Opitutales bacterium]
MTHKQTISILAACFFTVAAASAQPFELIDSGAAAPDFREQFLASYGVNPAIEPELRQEDRPLFERIEPDLRSNPRDAIRIAAAEIDEETNPAFHFLLGNLYYQTDQLNRSERALKQAVSKFPSFRRAYRTLGLIYIQSERFEEAIGAWLKVITLGGGDAQSYGLLAYAYLTQEKYRSALSAYEKARMFKPESTDFRRGQAQCLLQTGQLKQAAALFDELIAEDPAVTDYWLLQANAYLGLERYGDAMANLEILAGRGQTTRQSDILLGDLYLRDENHQLAVKAYQAALRRHGVAEIAEALRPLDYLVNRGLYDEAEAYLETLRTVLPTELDPDVRARLTVAEAGILLEQGEAAAVVDRLQPLVEAQPLAADALLLLGEAHQRLEAYEEAEFVLQRVRSIPGEKVEGLVALGRLEVQRGDFEAALEHLRAARELAPARPGLARYIESVEKAR